MFACWPDLTEYSRIFHVDMVECSRMFFVAVVARLELSIFSRAYINEPLCVCFCVWN